MLSLLNVMDYSLLLGIESEIFVEEKATRERYNASASFVDRKRTESAQNMSIQQRKDSNAA